MGSPMSECRMNFSVFHPKSNVECDWVYLSHEIGHWLQPLDEIIEVEKAAGLDQGVVNLLLDIQLEENIARIMPLQKATW